MTTKLLLVMAGGALGAVSRYGVALLAARAWGTHFPWGTLIVNLAGCFLIGLLFALVTISIPNEYTGQAQSVISKRRGQILGFDTKAGWVGWDEVKANMPQSELHDLIVDLRSLTLGVGTFAWKFDHLAELLGRDADQIVAQRKEEAA